MNTKEHAHVDTKKWERIVTIVTGVLLAVVIIGVWVVPHDKGSVNSIEANQDQEPVDMKQQMADFQAGLDNMNKNGYVDTKTHDVVLEAAKKFAADEANKSTPLTLTALYEMKLITEADFNTVKTGVEKGREDARQETYGPLVKSGAFKDVDSAEKAFLAFSDAYKELASTERDALNKEMEAASPALTDDQKKQKLDAFNADKMKRAEQVLAKMVKDKDLNQAQADALKQYLK